MMMAEAQSRNELKAGYVFVLSCPDDPGSIKIGSTAGDAGVYRNEPFGTNEPVPCKVEFAVHVPDRHEIEMNLTLKLAPKRLGREKNRFAATPDEAIAAAVELVGYDYTNAQITGVIFRKQVAILKKMETDFRSRHKSFTILNGELGEAQKKIRRYQHEFAERKAATERQEAQIAELRSQNAALAGTLRKARLTAYAAAGLALLAVAFVTANLAGLA